jgi:hypothetical protein
MNEYSCSFVLNNFPRKWFLESVRATLRIDVNQAAGMFHELREQADLFVQGRRY